MILVEKSETCLTLTLARPEKANALTAEMLEQILQAVGQARDMKCLILTGQGKVFSAGADLAAAKQGLATSPLWEQLSQAISDFPGLTIAALNGTAAGGSMGMVLACDLRICVAAAKFFYPVMALGFLPQPSDPKRMAALIGPSKTKMIFMTGQKITSDQALEWGLVDQVVTEEELLPRANELAAVCQGAAQNHVAAIKSMMS